MPHHIDSATKRPQSGHQSAGQISIALLVLAVTLFPRGMVAQGQSPENQAGGQAKTDARQSDSDEPNPERKIQQLIQQLASNSFAVRQSATEQLWELGTAAQQELENAASGGDTEVAKRAGEILAVLAMGIDVNTSPEVAELVLNFNSSEALVRGEILQHLIREEKFRLVFQLLEQVKSVEVQAELFNDVMDFNDTLILLARSDRWDDIEYILGHPITLKHESAAAIHYHVLNGTLESVIQKQEELLALQVKDGKSVSTPELLKLAGIYRMQQRFDNAERIINSIPEDEIRITALNQIVLEQGDWNRVAELMVNPEDVVRPDEQKIKVTPGQRALVNQFVGDREAYGLTVTALVDKAQKLEDDGDTDAAKQARSTLAEIGLANLDWPLVESNLDPEDIQQNFHLNLLTNRIGQAFAAIELESDVQRRDLWFARRLRNIKSLKTKAQRLDEKRQNSDEVEAELTGWWRICFDVVSQLGSLGLTDEAVLHYHTLFAASTGEENLSRRMDVIVGLVTLERYDAAWKLIERGFSEAEHGQLARFIFPVYQQVGLPYWNSILTKRYPDPIERLKVISGLINSPMGTIPGFDLELELAKIQSDVTSSQSGQLELYFADIYQYHGDEETSRRYLENAQDLGNQTAKRRLALESFQQGEFKHAVDFFDGVWQYRTSVFEACLAAEAYRQLGDQKNYVLRQCLAYAHWRDSYSNRSTTQSLTELEQMHLIEDFLKLDVYCVNGNGITSDRYRDDLAIALRETDPTNSVINRQLTMFQGAAQYGTGRSALINWSDRRIQLNLAQAGLLIEQGQSEAAVDLIVACVRFSPGDPAMGETLITQLDKAGASDQAGRLFDALSDFYFGILEQYPDSSLHHNNYAWICTCADRQTEHMLRHAERAVAQRPNNSSYLDTLATIQFLSGNRQSAIENCRRCIEINPSKPHYREQLKRFLGTEK